VAKSLVADHKIVSYRLELLAGSATGQAVVHSDWQRFSVKGSLKGLQLAKLSALQKELGRSFSGVLSGNFLFSGDRSTMEKAELKGDLRIRAGQLSFKKPVLELAELPFTEIKTAFQRRDGRWAFSGGVIRSSLLDGSFSASVQPGGSLSASTFQGKGSVRPRPEMFVGPGKKALGQMVRSHLQNGALPFTVGGTFAAPGVRFVGLTLP